MVGRHSAAPGEVKKSFCRLARFRPLLADVECATLRRILCGSFCRIGRAGLILFRNAFRIPVHSGFEGRREAHFRAVKAKAPRGVTGQGWNFGGGRNSTTTASILVEIFRVYKGSHEIFLERQFQVTSLRGSM